MADDPVPTTPTTPTPTTPDPYASPYASPYAALMPLTVRNPELADKFVAEHKAAIAAREKEMADAQQAQQMNVDKMSKLLDDTADRIRQSKAGQSNLSLMALGANMMGPGNFGDQVGRGLRGMIPVIEKQREDDQSTELKLAGLGLQKAQLQAAPLSDRLKYIQAQQMGDINAMRAIEQAQIRAEPAKIKAEQPQIKGNIVYNPKDGTYRNIVTGKTFTLGDNQTLSDADVKAAPTNVPTSAADKVEGVNEDYLKTLDPTYAATVRAVARGERQFPADRGKLTQEQTQLFEDVKKYDPSFSTLDYNVRANTLKDFTSGQSARNVTSMNTAVQHLTKLHDLAKQMNNSGSPDWNSFVNMMRTHGLLGQDSSALPTNFQAAAHPVAEEISKVFKGSNLSDSEIRSWEASLSPNMTPAQIQGAMDTLQELMSGRINALEDQYKRGMGKFARPFSALDDTSKQKLEYIKNNPIYGKPESHEGTPPNTPQRPQAPSNKPWERTW